jgi:transcriptional regulator with XRE-family HTH domain
MSLDDVAQAAGCTKSHVWEMEQDRSRNPTVAMVYGLAKALGTPFPVMAAAALATHLAAQAAAEQ